MALMMSSKSASITPTQSTTVVKNLFRAAFSSIAYIRNFFGDDCFQLASIGAARYHKIVGGEKEDVHQFVNWLEQGVFDALQHKYLEVVLLEVYSRELDGNGVKTNEGKKQSQGQTQNPQKKDLLECYSFKVAYSESGAQLRLTGSTGMTSRPQLSKDMIKKNASEVLRSLVELTHTLRPLPANRILSMKLMYMPHTPADYEPPFFTKAQEDEVRWFHEKPLRVSAGRLTTPYHQLSMTIRAKATQENKVATVLRKPETKGDRVGTGDENEGMQVDVGGSQGNSGRVGRPPLRESQDVPSMDNQAGATLKLRVKKPGVYSHATERRTHEKPGESAGPISGKTWNKSSKMKLSSSSKKVIAH